MKAYTALLSLLLLVPTFVQAERPLKIGVIIPMSGPVAALGEPIRNAIDLARSEQEEGASARLEFIFEDSRYDSKPAIAAFNKLVGTDKVDLVYCWGTTPSIAVAPLAERNQIPLVTLSGDPAVAGGRTYVIDFLNRIEDFSAIQMDHMRSRGFKKLAVVSTEIQYLETLRDGMKSNLHSGESITVLATFPPDSGLELNTVLARLRLALDRKEYDAVGVFLGIGQLSTFYQKMGVNRISIPTFGSDFMLDEEEMEKAGAAAVGAIFATPRYTPEFSRNYIERYESSTMLGYAANAYDFASLLFELFAGAEVNPQSSADVLSRIEQARPVQGAGGEFRFIQEDPEQFENPGKRFIYSLAVRQIVAGGGSVLLE